MHILPAVSTVRTAVLCLLLTAGLCLPTSIAQAQDTEATLEREATIDQNEISAVVLHPFMEGIFVCREHAEGELSKLGDARGQDCLAAGTEEKAGRQLIGLHEGDGLENEDYYGWKKPVLAPFDSVVDSVGTNPNVNQPGKMPQEESLPGYVQFRRGDGVRVVYAHVRDIEVAEGDSVAAGEVIAKVGNNGNSRAPHTHIGAWRGEEPLQIRWDLRAAGRLSGTLEDENDN